MFAGGVIIILGMIIISTTNTFAQVVVGRFVLGLGIAVMTVAAPAYAVEVAPPHWRGRCTGFYNCGWFGGAIPAAIITFGTNYMDNNYSWRIPLILQAFACVIVMGGVFFIPESPRWLVANGREEEALAFLIKYHGNGDPNSRLVRLEIEEMREGIAVDGIDKVWWDYRPFLLTHSGRWRLAQVLMISIFGQFSGNGLGYFNTVIFDGLGIKDVPTQLGYNILNQVLSAIGALTAVSLTDRMPRRKVLIIGTFLCAAALATNSGLSAALDKQTQEGSIDLNYGKGALASYFLFNIIFSFTYTPLQGAIPTEALETTTRAKGLALSGFIVNGMGFINMFAGPIALGNIGYKYIFVFVGWDLVECAFWYFFGYVTSLVFRDCIVRVSNQKTAVSSPRAAPSSSWSGSTTSPTPSRPRSRSTRSSSPTMARSPRRSLPKSRYRCHLAAFGLGVSVIAQGGWRTKRVSTSESRLGCLGVVLLLLSVAALLATTVHVNCNIWCFSMPSVHFVSFCPAFPTCSSTSLCMDCPVCARSWQLPACEVSKSQCDAV